MAPAHRSIVRSSSWIALIFVAAGLWAWRVEVDTAFDADERGRAVAVDPNGDVLAAGRSGGAFAVLKRSRGNGAELWTARVPGTVELADGEATDVVVDGTGDVFAAGWVTHATTGVDFAVVKLAGTDGSILWSVHLDGTGGVGGFFGIDRASRLALDSSGDVVVVGTLDRLFTGLDFAIVKLDGATGKVLWSYVVDGDDDDVGSPHGDVAFDVAVDAAGSIAAVGAVRGKNSTSHPVNYDWAVIKVSANGVLEWRRDVDYGLEDIGRTIAFDASGDVVTGGDVATHTFSIMKHNGATGTLEWGYVKPGPYSLSGFAYDVEIAANGDVVAAGEIDYGSTGFDAFVARLDGSTGAELWSQHFDEAQGGDRFHAISLDGSGDVYLAGRSEVPALQGGRNYAVRKLAGTSGSVVWSEHLSGAASPSSGDQAFALIYDGGYVFTTGVLENGTPTDGDFTIVRFDAQDGSHGTIRFPGFYFEWNPIWENKFLWVLAYDNADELVLTLEEGFESDPALRDAVWATTLEEVRASPDRVIVFTPDDELTAVYSLAEASDERLETAPVFLLLEEGGRGIELLRVLVEAGEWRPYASFAGAPDAKDDARIADEEPASDSSDLGPLSVMDGAADALDALRKLQRDSNASYSVNRRLEAYNEAQAFRLRFGNAGASVSPDRGGTAERVAFDLELAAIGRASGLEPVADVDPTARGPLVEYARVGLAESFENGPAGLAQGFTLSAPPRGTGELRLAIGFRNATPRESETDGFLELRERGGNAVFAHYGPLLARDARGEMLPCDLELVGRLAVLRVDDSVAEYPVEINSLVFTKWRWWRRDASLSAAFGSSSTSYGHRVDAHGVEVAVAGFGKVDLYRRELPGGWTRYQTLTGSPNDPVLYGASVDLESARMAIGAVQNDGMSLGYVDIYERTTLGDWALAQRVTPANIPSGDLSEFNFGRSIALDGNHLAVGANRFGLGRGLVFLYERTGGVWSQTTVLSEDPFLADMNYGHEVHLDGDTLVVSQPGEGAPDIQPGSVFVYRFGGSGWSLEQQISPGAGSMTPDAFGVSCALDGDTLVVRSKSGLDAYSRTGMTWTPVWHRPMAYAYPARYSMDLEGSTLMVGERSAESNGSAQAGRVDVYRVTGPGTFVTDGTLRSSTPEPSGQFGSSVSISASGYAAVGAVGEERVHMFRWGSVIDMLFRWTRGF